MIAQYRSLSSDQQKQVQALMRECEAHDQSTISIQVDHSLNYFADMHSWLLYLDGHELTGVLSVFNPLSDVAEISGCIKPDKRNTGRFNELITAAKAELAAHNIERILFVVDTSSATGMNAIKQRQLTCDHVEYLMRYEGTKRQNTTPIQLREATLTDVADYIRINSALFHETYEESHNIIVSSLQSPDRRIYMATIEDRTIGICTLFYAEENVTIYGLGIDESEQGKGYGYRLVCAVLDVAKERDRVVELEVDSLNKKAYNLYRKAGFKEIRVVNYYKNS